MSNQKFQSVQHRNEKILFRDLDQKELAGDYTTLSLNQIQCKYQKNPLTGSLKQLTKPSNVDEKCKFSKSMTLTSKSMSRIARLVHGWCSVKFWTNI